MPLSTLYQLDPTSAASNSNYAGADIAENCAPSGVNNALRALGQMVAQQLCYQSAAISASVSTNIATASTGLFMKIDGAGAINSFGVVPGEQPAAAVVRILHYNSSASVSHDNSRITLLGRASRKMQPGDIQGLIHDSAGDQWREFLYSNAAGFMNANSISVTELRAVECGLDSISSTQISVNTLNAASASVTAIALTGVTTLNANSISASIGEFTTLRVGGHGVLCQRYMRRYTAHTTISSSQAIPGDDTIPQITEGVELASITITPVNASSILNFRATWFGGAANVNMLATMAIFKDSDANALAAASQGHPGSANTSAFSLEYFTSASSTAQRVYHLRAGPDAGGTICTNGFVTGGARLYGGVAGITFTVEEMLPQ
jgi:hypothetical protein